MRNRLGVLALLALVAGAPAMAEDRAVVIAQGGALDAEALAGRLQAAGMASAAARDVTAAQLPGPLERLQAPAPSPGTRLVVLAGQFVSAGGDSWLMASDAAARGLAYADRDGISVGHVVTLMRDGSRRGFLLLAEAPGGPARGPRLQPGVGPMRGAAGVSVIAGPPEAVAAAATALATPGTSLPVTLLGDARLRLVSGPAAGALEAGGAPRTPANAPPATEPQGGALTRPALPGEAEAWVLAAAQRSVAAYQDFLAAFPDGRYAAVARQRISRLGGTPPTPSAAPAAAAPADAPPAGAEVSARAAVAEIALNLSLGERSQVQRILSGLGYDTGGTDGAFGSATRAAIRRWQGDSGLGVTGYLDPAQLDRLRRGAGAR